MLKYRLLFLLTIGFMLLSCDKDKSHTSLLGSWNCDEYPEISLPSSYQVNILRNTALPKDSNQYVIYNFNNLGYSEEQAVFIEQKSDSEVSISGTNIIGITISGSGTIANDFSTIEWQYVVNKEGREEFRATYY